MEHLFLQVLAVPCGVSLPISGFLHEFETKLRQLHASTRWISMSPTSVRASEGVLVQHLVELLMPVHPSFHASLLKASEKLRANLREEPPPGVLKTLLEELIATDETIFAYSRGGASHAHRGGNGHGRGGGGGGGHHGGHGGRSGGAAERHDSSHYSSRPASEVVKQAHARVAAALEKLAKLLQSRKKMSQNLRAHLFDIARQVCELHRGIFAHLHRCGQDFPLHCEPKDLEETLNALVDVAIGRKGLVIVAGLLLLLRDFIGDLLGHLEKSALDAAELSSIDSASVKLQCCASNLESYCTRARDEGFSQEDLIANFCVQGERVLADISCSFPNKDKLLVHLLGAVQRYFFATLLAAQPNTSPTSESPTVSCLAAGSAPSTAVLASLPRFKLDLSKELQDGLAAEQSEELELAFNEDIVPHLLRLKGDGVEFFFADKYSVVCRTRKGDVRLFGFFST